MWRVTDRRVTTIYFAPSMTHAKCNTQGHHKADYLLIDVALQATSEMTAKFEMPSLMQSKNLQGLM